PLPTQRIRSEVARHQPMQARYQSLDSMLWILDQRSPSRRQYIRLSNCDLPQALNQIPCSCGIAVIPARLGFRNCVLQTRYIEQLSVAIDEVARARNPFAARLDPVRDSPGRVARRIDYLDPHEIGR